MDVYLVDQLLRERVPSAARVFDAGCGSGRNLAYFLRAGHPVRGVDADAEAIEAARALARRLRPELPTGSLRCARLEHLQGEEPAELVVCNAVLHFARDEEHFGAMLRGAWNVVAPGGVFFCRLASSIGLPAAHPLGAGRYRVPDGSERYLVDRKDLTRWTAELGAILLDPVKTTLVEDLRAMTTWILRRPGFAE